MCMLFRVEKVGLQAIELHTHPALVGHANKTILHRVIAACHFVGISMLEPWNSTLANIHPQACPR